MPLHKNITFHGLHKAIFSSGDVADRPSTPDGFGDIYWAHDTEELYIADDTGAAWSVYNPAGTPPPSTLDDLTDVTIGTPTLNQFLQYNGSAWVNATYSPASQDIGDLGDVTLGGSLDNGAVFVYYDIGPYWTSLAPGTNGQVLMADDTETLGLRWTTPATGDLTTNTADYIQMPVLSSAPVATPASGYIYLYEKSDGVYYKRSDGVSKGPLASTLDDLADVVITTANKGHLLVHNGTNWVNLSPGSNGQIIYIDTTTTTGLRWGSLSSGGSTDDDLRRLFWLGF